MEVATMYATANYNHGPLALDNHLTSAGSPLLDLGSGRGEFPVKLDHASGTGIRHGNTYYFTSTFPDGNPHLFREGPGYYRSNSSGGIQTALSVGQTEAAGTIDIWDTGTYATPDEVALANWMKSYSGTEDIRWFIFEGVHCGDYYVTLGWGRASKLDTPLAASNILDLTDGVYPLWPIVLPADKLSQPNEMTCRVTLFSKPTWVARTNNMGVYLPFIMGQVSVDGTMSPFFPYRVRLTEDGEPYTFRDYNDTSTFLSFNPAGGSGALAEKEEYAVHYYVAIHSDLSDSWLSSETDAFNGWRGFHRNATRSEQMTIHRAKYYATHDTDYLVNKESEGAPVNSNYYNMIGSHDVSALERRLDTVEVVATNADTKSTTNKVDIAAIDTKLSNTKTTVTNLSNKVSLLDVKTTVNGDAIADLDIRVSDIEEGTPSIDVDAVVARVESEINGKFVNI